MRKLSLPTALFVRDINKSPLKPGAIRSRHYPASNT
jgi:hypothetical protein